MDLLINKKERVYPPLNLCLTSYSTNNDEQSPDGIHIDVTPKSWTV